MLRLWTIVTLVSFALVLPLVASAGAAPSGRAVPGSVTEFPLPNPDSRPYSIVRGPDGALWFTESSRGDDRAHHDLGHLQGVSRPPTFDSGPYGITVGADGNLWFTERFADQIGRILPSGQITELLLHVAERRSPGTSPPGPDGSFYFTEENIDQIGVIYGRRDLRVPGRRGNVPDRDRRRPPREASGSRRRSATRSSSSRPRRPGSIPRSWSTRC